MTPDLAFVSFLFVIGGMMCVGFTAFESGRWVMPTRIVGLILIAVPVVKMLCWYVLQ
jgi:hypothetical protein